MMIVTLQTNATPTPDIMVHGDIVKIDLGALVIEMDTETFKSTITRLIVQAAAFDINIPSYR